MDKRFNPDCNNLEECIEYFTKRARQMLRFDFVLDKIIEYKEGCKAHFTKGNQEWHALYIYPEYRGKGMYAKMMPVQHTKVVTSDDCGIEQYLKDKGYTYHCIHIYDNYYAPISNYYGDKKAARSGVDYMNHIDEGLAILKWIGVDEDMEWETYAAYAFHPIFQMDEDLKKNVDNLAFHNSNSISLIGKMNLETVIYAMEYRSVANEYLSTRKITSLDEIRLSPLKAVNNMLIADKIQNRKDFELYHEQTHPRRFDLVDYFILWLTKLKISEPKYQEIKQRLLIQPRIVRL